jgi:hypothetical protein
MSPSRTLPNFEPALIVQIQDSSLPQVTSIVESDAANCAQLVHGKNTCMIVKLMDEGRV